MIKMSVESRARTAVELDGWLERDGGGEILFRHSLLVLLLRNIQRIHVHLP